MEDTSETHERPVSVRSRTSKTAFHQTGRGGGAVSRATVAVSQERNSAVTCMLARRKGRAREHENKKRGLKTGKRIKETNRREESVARK